MDLLAALPDTRAGRHTQWLWSWMLAVAQGSLPPKPGELAEHFAPSVLEQVPAERIITHFEQLASHMTLVIQLVEEASSDHQFTALLGLPDSWLRYTCTTQDNAPHLLLGAGYLPALDPRSYSDQRMQREGRDVSIRDFGGTGPLMLVWHGAGCDRAIWEALVPHLAGFRIVAQDLPGHGHSPLKVFSTGDALADADAVVAALGQGAPILVGHSLGGYLGLRYAATRRCAGWIGLDGPFGLIYPWDVDDPGLPESLLQIGREIRAIDVASDLAALNCPAMLVLCAKAGSAIEDRMVPGRRELAKHLAQHLPKIRIEWVQTGHDALLFHQPQETAAQIRDFLTFALIGR